MYVHFDEINASVAENVDENTVYLTDKKEIKFKDFLHAVKIQVIQRMN